MQAFTCLKRSWVKLQKKIVFIVLSCFFFFFYFNCMVFNEISIGCLESCVISFDNC